MKDVQRHGGEGVVVSGGLRMDERECPMQEHGKDHIAEVTIICSATEHSPRWPSRRRRLPSARATRSGGRPHHQVGL